ncbi:MAG: sensor histidine kinase [Christensenellaceae bacterium]
MRFLEYMKSKKSYLACLMAVMLVMLLMFWGLSVDAALIIFVLVVIGIGFLIPFILEFYKKKKFYDETRAITEEIENKCLLTEIIAEPDFLEGQILFELLKTSNKFKLEEINKYKFAQEEYREFIELWVHEIKTPISSAKLALENDDSEKKSDIIDDIQMIEDLVERVLYYSRSNTVEKDYFVKKENIKEILFGVVRKNAKAFIQKNIAFVCEIQDAYVYSDAKWLAFILNQIFSNAIKYSNKQNAKIEALLVQNQNSTDFIIRDNGIGISEHELLRAFDKGFTGTNGRINEKSTGMGLYLCKKLCDKLGHGISIASKNGTTVTISFPHSSMYVL